MEALGYEVVAELQVFGVFSRGKVKERKKVLAEASDIGTLLAKAIS